MFSFAKSGRETSVARVTAVVILGDHNYLLKDCSFLLYVLKISLVREWEDSTQELHS
jgi:hypothetical protein